MSRSWLGNRTESDCAGPIAQIVHAVINGRQCSRCEYALTTYPRPGTLSCSSENTKPPLCIREIPENKHEEGSTPKGCDENRFST